MVRIGARFIVFLLVFAILIGLAAALGVLK